MTRSFTPYLCTLFISDQYDFSLSKIFGYLPLCPPALLTEFVSPACPTGAVVIVLTTEMKLTVQN